MIPQALGTDGSGFGEMIAEEEGQFEEPITIRRFASQSATPSAFGTPLPPSSPTDYPATAVVVEMNVAAKLIAADVLQAGDLVLQMRDRLNEAAGNVGGSQLADRVIYRGMEYRMVQRPHPVTMGQGLSGEAQFYIVHLRRTNSTADTAGS